MGIVKCSPFGNVNVVESVNSMKWGLLNANAQPTQKLQSLNGRYKH